MISQRHFRSVVWWLPLVLLTLVSCAKASAQSDTPDAETIKLRRIYMPFEDLEQWMETRPAYLPMSYQRYTNLVAFANRNQASKLANPIRHQLNLSRSGFLEGESWFEIPEASNTSENPRIGLPGWTLPSTFSQATVSVPRLLNSGAEPAETPFSLSPVPAGIDQNGRFGLTASSNSNWLVAKFDLSVSTGELFDGQRVITLPTNATTQTFISVPTGIHLHTAESTVVTPLHWVPTSSDDDLEVGDGFNRFLIGTTSDQLKLSFSSSPESAPSQSDAYLEYSENSRIFVDTSKQSYEATLVITNTLEVTPGSVEIVMPPEMESRTCFVNGKPGQGELRFHSNGQSSWIIPVNKGDFPLELIVDGNLSWQSNQMQAVPRLQIPYGTFTEGTTRVETQRPATIHDFQLINCRFEASAKDTASREIRVRYLSEDSQFRVMTGNDDFAPNWRSFARINFQDDFLQSQQWIDFDFRFAINSTLRFHLDPQWNIGQLAIRAQNQPASTEQTLQWYRDGQSPNTVMVDIPDNLLGQQVRLRFQGRRRIEFGVHRYFEGLAPLSNEDNKTDSWKRLVAMTSNSPTIANIGQQFQQYSIEPELVRQQNLDFASLIQLEPTFDFVGNQTIEFDVQFRDTSSYSVEGSLHNKLVSEKLLLQDFEFQLAASGSSLQRFPVEFNVQGPDEYVWDLRDSDNQPVEYVIEPDDQHPNRLWFQLKEPISTTLTIRQQRQMSIAAPEGQAFPLPVYSFPEAVPFQTQVFDHSVCGHQLWYPNGPNAIDRKIDRPETNATISAKPQEEGSVSYVFSDNFGAPAVRCLPIRSSDTQLLISSVDYLHQTDAQKVRTSCFIETKTKNCKVLFVQLPPNATFDSVSINGIPAPAKKIENGISIPLQSFASNKVEVRYWLTNAVEIYQFTPVDCRVTLPQPPILETQAVILADGLSLWSPDADFSVVQSLVGRWLFTDVGGTGWNYNRIADRWRPNSQFNQSFCIVNQRNLNALKLLLSMVFLIVGFLFWSSILYVGQSRWTLNAPLLLIAGLLVIFASLPLAQLGASACWGILGGHVLGYVRSRTQSQLKLVPADRLLSTLSRSLLVIFVVSISFNDSTVHAQQADSQQLTSSVVIPTDDEGEHGSVVYLDRDTYARFSELEKELGQQAQIDVLTSRYRLFYSPTKVGYDKLQSSFTVRAKAGGFLSLPLPSNQSETISDVQINGVAAGYRTENGQLILNLPAADEIVVSFETQLSSSDKSGYLSIVTLPTADNVLELRGVPTTWMVQLFDEPNAELLERSFSKRNFQLSRILRLGIHVAADRSEKFEASLETQLNVGMNRVVGHTWIHLGLYRKMTNKVRLQTDSRLNLPARYYFATAGFQISELESDSNTNIYEITFSEADEIPERFKIDWETKVSAIGQLMAPKVRLLTPTVKATSHIGLVVDRRLVFQPSTTNDRFLRITQKRFPSQQAIVTAEPLDYVFLEKSDSATTVTALGELRMQPVQANGNMNLKYYVGLKRTRWEFEGQVNLVLGELPQLRFSVPKGFQLDDVFLSNDFQNQVAWTNTVATERGHELICFLQQPLSGNLQLRVSGSQPTSEAIYTGLFSSQLPNLRYEAGIYHTPEVSVESKTQLVTSTSASANDLEFQLHKSFQLTSEQAAGGTIQLAAQPITAAKHVDTYLQIQSHADGNLNLLYQIMIDGGKKPVEDLTFQLPSGLGTPTLVGDPVSNPFDAKVALEAELTATNDQVRIRWLKPKTKAYVAVSIPVTGKLSNVPLADFYKVGGNHFLLKDDFSDSSFNLSTSPVSIPSFDLPASLLVGKFKLSENQNTPEKWVWYELNREASQRQLSRINSPAVRREWPVLEFQQFNFRTTLLRDKLSLDGIHQLVIRSRASDHSVKINVPEGQQILNAWVNKRLVAPRESGPQEIELALSPTSTWHIITLRIQMDRFDALPTLPQSENRSVLFAPDMTVFENAEADLVVEPSANSSPELSRTDYSTAFSNIHKAIDETVGKESLIRLTTIPLPRTETTSVGLQIPLPPVASELPPPEPDTLRTVADAKLVDAIQEQPITLQSDLKALVPQLSTAPLVASDEPHFQPKSPPVRSNNGLLQFVASLFGVIVVAIMLWKSDTLSPLLCAFTGILSATYGWIAITHGEDLIVGAPLIAFSILSFSFLIKQRLNRINAPVQDFS